MADESALQEVVHDAVSAAYSEHGTEGSTGGGMVLEWALTTEVIGPDGRIWLSTLRSRDLSAWKALGMLESHAGDLRHILLTSETDD